MSVKRKLGTLEDYQAYVSPVAGRYSLLLTEMEILRPTLSQELREKFSLSGKHLGLHIIMMSLLNQCVIHAFGLLEGSGGLEGRNPSNIRPSLRVLVHPFLKENEQSCAKLLDRLKNDPPSRPELIIHLEGAQPGRRSRIRSRRPRSVLEDRLQLVRNDWEFLKGKRDALEEIRHKVSAHGEIKLSSVELNVQATNPKNLSLFESKKTEIFEHSIRPPFDDVWNALVELVPPLGRTISHLAQILVGANFDVDKMRESNARKAAIFWGVADDLDKRTTANPPKSV
jgi:hypothetical protein